MTRPDGLSRAEHGAWRQLIEAARTASGAFTSASAQALNKAATAAYRTPVPGPTDRARLALFRDLCVAAGAFALTAKPGREAAGQSLRALAEAVDAIVGPAEPEPYARGAREPRKDIFE